MESGAVPSPVQPERSELMGIHGIEQLSQDDEERPPPTPRGYDKVLIPDDRGEKFVLSCKQCGGLVLYPVTHNKWHKEKK